MNNSMFAKDPNSVDNPLFKKGESSYPKDAFINWWETNFAKPLGDFFSGRMFSQLWNGLSGQASADATREANERNIANQNYWNQITMEREDTAIQRQVADIQAAGLNPWLAMGNGATTTALNTTPVDPVDGSKILSATSAAALLAITKLLLKK